MQPKTLTLGRLTTPIGTALLLTDEAGVLRAFDWADYEAKLGRWIARHHPGAAVVEGKSPTAEAFAAYFDGATGALATVRRTISGTAFQRAVWTALMDIPAGETWSYRQLATAIGRPSAVRAVGLANGANPLAVVIPCHRVIGSNGALTGYGGGLPRKEWLLAHERRAVGQRAA